MASYDEASGPPDYNEPVPPPHERMSNTAVPEAPALSHAEQLSGSAWYVVHTKPRLEATAREHLLRQEFEVYLPMFKVFKPPRSDGRRRTRAQAPENAQGSHNPARIAKAASTAASTEALTVLEPMFPRYLFLRPTRPTQSLASVRSTQGVSRLVMFGNQPARLAQAIVDGIRQAEALREHADLPQISPYQPGTAVRLLDPALGGLQALVQAVSKDRVTLLLEILGRPQLVSVDFDRIAPV